MRKRLILRLLVALLLPTLACQLVSPDDVLPPTATPEPRRQPTATPENQSVAADGEFFVLNLSDSDQEGLELRANEIYEALIAGGGEVDREVLLEAYAELAEYERVGGEWQNVGPAPIEGVYMPQGRIPGSGRVNGFAIDPRNPDRVIAAASIGGLWKTEDGGRTWRSLIDEQVPLIYGGIELDPANPDTVYALLGEFDGQVGYYYGYLANGMMRSTDFGETWELIGQDTFLGASVTGLVWDEDGVMYASSGQLSIPHAPPDQPEFGVFRSEDGGDTWERLLACSDFGFCTPDPSSGATAYMGGFFDLDIASDGTLYTTLCNVRCRGTYILRSEDFGETWEELDYYGIFPDWEDYNGVYADVVDVGFEIPWVRAIELDVAPTDPDLLLAGGGIYWYDDEGNEGPWSFVMRSYDGGDTWEWLDSAGDYCTGTGGNMQCHYDNVIEIDPTDPDIMYVGGSLSIEPKTYNWVYMLQRSDDGGETWYDMTPAVEGSLMHADVHGMAFDPQDPNILWVGGDGGIYRTLDATEDPPEWESLAQGMNTLLFIDVALHPTDPDYLIGGMQDNARAYTTDRQTWIGAASGDGAYVAFDPFDPEIVYGTIYPPSIFERNEFGGDGDWTTWSPGGFVPGYIEGLDAFDNWPFYPRFEVDPNNEGVLYLGSNRVYRSDDRADSWYPVSDYFNISDLGEIYTLALAPSDSDVLYVGTSDGTAWVTFDQAETWEEITGDNFPERPLFRIVVHPEDPETAYAVFGGFNVQTPDYPGHVFVTTDGGQNWEDISYNLPDAPVAAVVVDVREEYAGVYVGGTLGVWVLQDGSDEWLPYGTGMPYALVTSLKLNPETGVMAASTYGRSVWVMDMP